METKGFFQFETIINGLVSSFRFIWIPMLYVHYEYFIPFSSGIDFIRQDLTSVYVRIWRIQTSDPDVKDGPRNERAKWSLATAIHNLGGWKILIFAQFESKYCKSCCLNSHCIPIISDLTCDIKEITNDDKGFQIFRHFSYEESTLKTSP